MSLVRSFSAMFACAVPRPTFAQRRAGLALCAVLVGGGCGLGSHRDQPRPTAPPQVRPECSARPLALSATEQSGLAAPAAAMRRQILRAASACDYAFLDRLAAEEPSFRYGFGRQGGGSGSGSGDHWQRAEASGEPALRVLFQLLHADFAQSLDGDQTVYVWPAASMPGAEPEDWASLGRIYGTSTVSDWRESRRYGGHRVGIDADGRWLFYVRGR